MKLKNFQRKEILVSTLEGHTIRFGVGESHDVPDSLITACLSKGLVPLEDVETLANREEKLAKEKAEAEAAEAEAKAKAAAEHEAAIAAAAEKAQEETVQAQADAASKKAKAKK